MCAALICSFVVLPLQLQSSLATCHRALQDQAPTVILYTFGGVRAHLERSAAGDCTALQCWLGGSTNSSIACLRLSLPAHALGSCEQRCCACGCLPKTLSVWECCMSLEAEGIRHLTGVQPERPASQCPCLRGCSSLCAAAGVADKKVLRGYEACMGAVQHTICSLVPDLAAGPNVVEPTCMVSLQDA